MGVYLFIALKRTYARSALATLPRFLALLLMYPAAVGFVFVSVIVVTVLTY